MANLTVEVMNMKQNKDSFLQKVKDNAFYLTFGIGLIALLVAVSIYTVKQQDNQIAQLDLNTASDYSELATEAADTKETNGQVTKKTGETTRVTTEVVQTTQDTEHTDVTETATESVTLPVSSPAGELNFNSEETIGWPVNGEVILPYSMETTVYFKTLDQYRCNPGMLIGADTGESVKSVYLGKVTKVTSDDVYGNMVTVYLGNNYSVVYGQLDAIHVKEGDYVKAGDVIGTVATPTDSFSEEGSHVFLQMLDEETPVDPTLFME